MGGKTIESATCLIFSLASYNAMMLRGRRTMYRRRRCAVEEGKQKRWPPETGKPIGVWKGCLETGKRLAEDDDDISLPYAPGFYTTLAPLRRSHSTPAPRAFIART